VECKTEQDKVISLGVSPGKVKVAPVLVNLDRFAQEKDTSIRQKYGTDKIVLYIGRLSVEKNVGLLIQAARIIEQKLPSVKFLIVGGGAEESKLKTIAEGLSNVVFVGRVPHDDIPKYHKAADVLVLPSFYEGIPLVVVEAAAAGLPVICTDVRDAQDVIIDEKTGYIVPKNKPEIMAGRILEILNDENKAHGMGTLGQQLVMKQFNPEENLKSCIELWRSV